MRILFLAIAFLTLVTSNANCQTDSNMKNTSTYSTEIIRYKVSDDQRESFTAAYTEAANHLKASKYCLGFDLIQGDEEPNNFIVIIYWTSKDEHLNGFRKSAEFGPFFNLVKPYYNNIQEMKHYEKKLQWKNEKS